jgi:hypothetical protein
MDLVFVDPAILVWDHAEYAIDQGRYWQIAKDVVATIALIEDCGLTVVLRHEMIDQLINSFPAEYLDHDVHELRDFVNVIYAFLAREDLHENDYPIIPILSCAPDFAGRLHFPQVLKDETAYALHYVLLNEKSSVVFTHECIAGANIVTATIRSATKLGNVECFASSARYQVFQARVVPVYEENHNHDSLSGYGSRLPHCLDPNDLQVLLDAATSRPDPRLVCAYSNKANTYIAFRKHFANRYHAYPVLESELSRMGVNPAAVVSA